MKKVALTSLLLLVMAGSIVAGTLASYTISLDVATGSVVAKEFIFIEEGTDSFKQGVKIAPSERVVWDFQIKNHDDDFVTETDMYYKVIFDVLATEDKEAIVPLSINVNNEPVGLDNGEGTFEITGAFPLSPEGQKADFTVTIDWPEDGEDDIEFAGHDFGTTVKVSAIATQVPFEGQEPLEPEEPEESGIHVHYKITSTWPTGFSYQFTITNYTEETIDGWTLSFYWPTNRVTNIGDGVRLTRDEPDIGWYTLKNPPYSLVKIEPGMNISFTGNASGANPESIENVSVNDQYVTLIVDLEN